MSRAASFFSSRWSGVAEFGGMLLLAFFLDFAFNQLAIVPLFGEDTLLLQCALAVPIGVATALVWRVVWRAVRAHALCSERSGGAS